MNPFRYYNIRGVYPYDVSDELAYRVGRAIVLYTEAKQVLVGYDVRNSSPVLFEALKKGITDQGGEAIDIGMCSKPLLEFYFLFKKFDAAAIITGGHSSKNFNGIKIMKKNSLDVYRENGLKNIEELSKKKVFPIPVLKGSVIKQYASEDYFNHLIKKFGGSLAKKKIVVDYSNGCGILSAKRLFNILRLNLTELNDKIDGNFISHDPDPLSESAIDQLREKVKSVKPDFGVIFDADCDRLFIVDENGEVLPLDFFITFLAEYELKKNPNIAVLLDLRLSKSVKEYVKLLGGEPRVVKVGEAYIENELAKDKKAMFAADLTGHILYKENDCINDPVFTLLKFLQILNIEHIKVSDIVKKYRKYYQTELMTLKMVDAKKAMDALKKNLKYNKKLDIDGLTLEFDAWWLNIRTSNSDERVIRIRVEADTVSVLEEKTHEITSILWPFIDKNT